jgi:predicted MPP superfamily phosphohydrolase
MEADDKPKPRRLLSRRGLLAAAGAAALGVTLDAYLIEPRWIEVTRRTLRIPGLPEALKGFRIVHVADFHLGNKISFDYLRGAVERAAGLRPDVLAITGDFVHHGMPYDPKELVRMMEPAAARLGVLGVLGNHDMAWRPERISDPLNQDTSVDLIDGQTRIIEANGARIQFMGVTDLESLDKGELASLAGQADPGLTRILLQHNPDLAEDLGDEMPKPHLQLSGHTHGGQVLLPGISRIPSEHGWKFAQGFVHGASHPVYVTRGIGGHSVIGGVPRFLCRPEISVLTLAPGAAESLAEEA